MTDDRKSDVLINGTKVLSQLDIVRETGEANKALTKEVKGISPANTLELS